MGYLAVRTTAGKLTQRAYRCVEQESECGDETSGVTSTMESATYIHRQLPDLAKLPPMMGPSESDTMNTALMRLRYELRCLSCVSSGHERMRLHLHRQYEFLRDTTMVHNDRRPAPPTPLMRRPTTSWTRLWAVPATMLPNMKIQTSTTNMHLVPNTSCEGRGII